MISESVEIAGSGAGSGFTGLDPSCAHCGDVCTDRVYDGEYVFCCQGCLWVYKILSEHRMTEYYAFEEPPRISLKNGRSVKFDYLDDPAIQKKIVQFSLRGCSKLTLFIPKIHCHACVWLLENLHRLDEGILESHVNFLKKELTITLEDQKTSIRAVIELLSNLGYEPTISLASERKGFVSSVERSLYIKLGIAGFAFGNIMLMAIPGYIAQDSLEPILRRFFGVLSMILTVPLLYSLSDYFKGTWYALRQRAVTMDVPVTIGIVVLWVKSLTEAVHGGGLGYFDSLAGLAFFLLLGKIFQTKTFHHLSFDRNYLSFFSLATTRRRNGIEEYIGLDEVRCGDELIIRNGEIIPADGILLSSETAIDYSFVTGEADPVWISQGEQVYAGGKILGTITQIQAAKTVNQSYLIDLWNNTVFSKADNHSYGKVSERFARFFTAFILVAAVSAGGVWTWLDASMVVNVVS
ncbi:MAG: heavy metal translocating P-type ATPase metal-binding domain-containing protein, partial [Bacteroidetes bacterium]|nr:heavy metal translocating P-type ATPase metal-binding domain-containing protein [Bacteroidota bacterium]